MAEGKAKAKAAEDGGAAEVQSKADAELEQGFSGTKVDPRPNEDYSLESGPDSPNAAEVALDTLDARKAALEASTASGSSS